MAASLPHSNLHLLRAIKNKTFSENLKNFYNFTELYVTKPMYSAGVTMKLFSQVKREAKVSTTVSVRSNHESSCISLLDHTHAYRINQKFK